MADNLNQPLASASVILYRPLADCQDPFELFLLKRQGESRFMPNRYVFPGGRVELHDGGDPFSEEALRACAIRELWEEAGVVLAREKDLVQTLDPRRIGEARKALQSDLLGLAGAMAGLGLTPDPGALVFYDRWITPTARPKRYDTVFYLARMPEAQTADCDRLETTHGVWLSPSRALWENELGEVSLAPPQVRILGELARLANLGDLVSPDRMKRDQPVLPFLWIEGKRRVILFPWDPDYQKTAPADPDKPGRPCEAGNASRLVHENGRWLPYTAVDNENRA